MLATYFALPLLALALPSLAAPAKRTQSPGTWSKTLQITTNSTGKTLLVGAPASTIEVTEFLIQAFAPNPLNHSVVANASTISGTYAISAHAYIPENPSTTCFFATHGIGADSSWWDFKVAGDNNSYSFVDAANSQGFPVFSYDRLGVGKSAKPDGVQVVQSSLHVSIAHELIQQVRAGDIPNLKCEKIVGVGHSFGSIISTGLAAKYGNGDLDAVVLTGFSIFTAGEASSVTAFHSAIASEVSPKRFGSLKDTSYWLWDNAIAGHIGFLHYPSVTTAAAKHFEAGKQTYTLGELTTLGDPIAPSLEFSGPVSVVTGEQDAIFCAGNCYAGVNGTSVLPDVAALFPKVSHFNSTVVPATGHGISVHTSAAATYAGIVAWTKGLSL